MSAAELETVLRVQNERVIEADRQASWPRCWGQCSRLPGEIVGLSYDEAVARLGCTADWLVRVDGDRIRGGGPEEVARILAEYGVREAKAADTMIDMARRVAAPPLWLARAALG